MLASFIQYCTTRLRLPSLRKKGTQTPNKHCRSKKKDMPSPNTAAAKAKTTPSHCVAMCPNQPANDKATVKSHRSEKSRVRAGHAGKEAGARRAGHIHLSGKLLNRNQTLMVFFRSTVSLLQVPGLYLASDVARFEKLRLVARSFRAKHASFLREATRQNKGCQAEDACHGMLQTRPLEAKSA